MAAARDRTKSIKSTQGLVKYRRFERGFDFVQSPSSSKTYSKIRHSWFRWQTLSIVVADISDSSKSTLKRYEIIALHRSGHA